MRTAIVLMLLLCAGCQEATQSTASLDRVATLYQEGLDASAASTAAMVVRQGGQDATTAAWYGGLAEYRQGHAAAARRFFEQAATSPTPAIAGGAESMLGQLAQQRADTTAAMKHYEQAWTDLRGPDRRQVALHAIAAAQRDRDTTAAASWKRRLAGQPSDVTMASSSFALQAGAYQSRTGAEQHATRLRHSHGGRLQPIVVRGRTGPSGTMWLVQGGAYETRRSAAAARRTLGADDFIVVRTAAAHSPEQRR
ncbi:MAG: SPOR domain-containing protein [Phycisphaerales bacterium]|nr:SPOR domain-containing protein [Phycisphaerales bacterium]